MSSSNTPPTALPSLQGSRQSPAQRSVSGAPTGVGLGLRWDFLDEVLEGPLLPLAFFEVSPENYMRRGGYYPAALEALEDRYRFITHGLTLSLGAIDPAPAEYLRELKREIERLGSPWHSDHLCFSSSGPVVLHDLLPLKHCRENVVRVVERLERTQDALGRPMAFENISYYAHPGLPELPESEFISEILRQSSAGLLLDVNNVYVNSLNHGFDAGSFILSLPLERVVQIHVAGHAPSKWDPDLIIDTHGTPVCDPVLDLLKTTIGHTGPLPVLLERDNEVPELAELLLEVRTLERYYAAGLAEYEERHARSA